MGAGAIGGHLAARFWKGGADVTAVARGAQLDALKRGPLRVLAPEEEIIATIPATDDPAQLGPQDAVIVAVKAPTLPAVAAAIGVDYVKRTPVAVDLILASLDSGKRVDRGRWHDGRRVAAREPGLFRLHPGGRRVPARPASK